MVLATTIGGRHQVNGSYVRFAQRSEHHDSKQPVLVVFTEDQRSRSPPYASPSESGKDKYLSSLRQTFPYFILDLFDRRVSGKPRLAASIFVHV